MERVSNNIYKKWIKKGNIISSRNHDLPADIRYDGDQQRYWTNKKGQIRREKDLPAVIDYNGYKLWFKEGICTRKKLPTIICHDGDKCWSIQ